MIDARQLVSTKIMPTDRSRPPVSTGIVCAIATRASSTPLLAAVLMTLAAEADRLLRAVEREHDDEDRDGEQQAALGAEAMRQPLPERPARRYAVCSRS